MIDESRHVLLAQVASIGHIECNTNRTTMKNTFTDGLAIIFDFGGVLFDWDPHYLYLKLFNGDRQAVDRFLNEINFSEWNLRQDQGRPFSIAVAEHCAKFPHYCDLIRAYDTRWEESLNGPIWESVEILQALRDEGHPLYALSNWSAEKFVLIRPRYGFFDWFTSIVISGNVGIAKPDPRIFELTFKKIGYSASRCLVIDDSQQNIEIATQMGCLTIHFQSPHQLKAELNSLGIAINN
jgi:2-haloacid dehalogenase